MRGKFGSEFWFRLLGFIVRHLSGKGLERSPLVGRTYRFLTRRLIGEDIVSVVVHGQKMHVNTTFGLTLQAAGTYISERLMSNLFIDLLTDGMVVVDIGAHIGYYTLFAAKAVGDKGKVFCFEPEPANYVLLLKNIEENNCNNVIPVQKAVSNSTGSIKLFIAKEPSGHSIGSDNPHQKAIVVDSITLDEFFSGREYPIHVIKIDVEGAEMAVLQGMRNIIAKNRQLNIFTEFNPGALKRVGFSPIEYFQMLIDFGFNICVINEQKQSLEQVEINTVMAMCKSIEYMNLLCRKV